MSMTVNEIRDLLAHADMQEFLALESALAADSRKGVAAALDVCRRRLAAETAERERIDALYAFDAKHGACVIGLDEVGRGAVAGPLAVGAVVLPADPHISLLNDSKQLSAAQRESVASEIRNIARAWTVFYVEAEDIDRYGMSSCLRKAFSGALSAIEATGITPDCVLIDGNPLGLDEREVNVIKGDATSAAIAAASIVAKVARDGLMCDYAQEYPGYGFDSHKGYGSEGHIQAICNLGLTPIHRESFCRSFNQPTLF